MKLSAVACALATSFSIAAQVDHRPSQSPVKSQGGRGTCVAFSICAALETFPGVPTNLSEQLLYATVKLHQNDVDKWLRRMGKEPLMREGNIFDIYVPLFQLVGTSHEAFLPYDPNPKKAPATVPAEIRRFLELAQMTEADLGKIRDGFGKYGFKAEDCTLLMGRDAQDVDRIKKELDGGRLAIPVSYSLYGPKWSSADDDPKATRTFIHPGLMHAYRRKGVGKEWWNYGRAKGDCAIRKVDFVDQVRSGALEIGVYPDPDKEFYGGHAVTIVGYDDRGFLVKNSWGDWGDDGYCTVLFDYHALYARRALLIDDVYIRTPILSPFKNGAALREGDFRLKVQRRGAADAMRYVLSTWMLEPRDADVEVVEYDIEVRDGDGAWTRLHRGRVRTGQPEDRHGAPLVLRGDLAERVASAKAVRVTGRYGGTQVPNPNDPDAATFHRTVRFATFDPNLKSAIDVAPAR